MKTFSAIDSGFDGYIAEIECQISNGLPSIIIVGFANKAVDEAKERIRGAFASSSLPFPKKRLTINLAPADIPKDTTALDLSIATSVLLTAQTIPPLQERTIILGELGLDGSVRPIRGIIGKLLCAQKHGFKAAIVPSDNSNQACMVDGITILPVGTLQELYLHLSGTSIISPAKHAVQEASVGSFSGEYQDIVGQATAKRALEIAAAGHHNVLLDGPPGTGKSMLAKALPSILPSMTRQEILEITHLHSLCSKNYESLITARPFRAPHHSASDTAITGGGQKPRPGEISLAHHGVLFFDEFPEFRRGAIEALRQPLEDGKITVARAKDSLEFPASFILVATANPCPCGYFGTHRECSCAPAQLLRYRQKLSGPIMDRIDLYANVENVAHERLLEADKTAETSQTIRERVARARKIQQTRYGQPRTNSQMSNQDIKTSANLTPEAKNLLNQAGAKLELSPRAYMRTLKVARTIADLENSQPIRTQHIAEALQYRPALHFDL